jgi:hypothetical protein
MNIPFHEMSGIFHPSRRLAKEPCGHLQQGYDLLDKMQATDDEVVVVADAETDADEGAWVERNEDDRQRREQ